MATLSNYLTSGKTLGTVGSLAGTLAAQGSKYAPLYGTAGSYLGNTLSNLLKNQGLGESLFKAGPGTLGAAGGAIGQLLGGQKYGPYAGAAGSYLGNVGKSLIGGQTMGQSLGGNLAGGVTGFLGSLLGKKNPALSYIGGQLGTYAPSIIEQAAPSLASSLGLQGATKALSQTIAPASVLGLGGGQTNIPGWGGIIANISPALLGWVGQMISLATGAERKQDIKAKKGWAQIQRQVVDPILNAGASRAAPAGIQFDPVAFGRMPGGGPEQKQYYQTAYNKGLQAAEQGKQQGLIPIWEDGGGGAPGSLETTPNRIHMIPGSDQEQPGGVRAPVLNKPYLKYLLTPGEYEMYRQTRMGTFLEPGVNLDPTFARMLDMQQQEKLTGQKILTDEDRNRLVQGQQISAILHPASGPIDVGKLYSRISGGQDKGLLSPVDAELMSRLIAQNYGGA